MFLSRKLIPTSGFTMDTTKHIGKETLNIPVTCVIPLQLSSANQLIYANDSSSHYCAYIFYRQKFHRWHFYHRRHHRCRSNHPAFPLHIFWPFFYTPPGLHKIGFLIFQDVQPHIYSSPPHAQQQATHQPGKYYFFHLFKLLVTLYSAELYL